MDEHDRRAIEGVFDRLRTVERMGAARDPEAERYVAERLAAQPGAAYYMAQTIVMQQQALEQVEGRGAGRMPQASRPPEREGGGGMLGGLFGRRERQPEPRAVDTMPGRGPGPWDRPQPGGGGFLAGAARTAMGVAGGVVLGNMIGGMFDGGEAQAAEAEPDPVEDQSEQDYADDAGGDDFGGGDFGDF